MTQNQIIYRRHANTRGGSRFAGVNFEILMHAGVLFNHIQRLQA
jgi:hypothetical protein